ncbi:MAG TPA: nuclear transport factor 2 family protein [Thermoanaerobaculia bacterium]|jgi:ketosteroid isomerase-like protein
MRRYVVFAAVIALSLLGQNVFGQCSEADKRSLEAFDRAWGDAGEKGDRAALMSIYADDYTDVSPTGTTNKTQSIDSVVRQAERDRANPGMASKVDHDYYIISCTPNSALITHRNVTTRPNGTKSYSRSVHALEKRNGKWVVVSNAGHPLSDAGILLYMEHEWSDADMKNNTPWYERNFADDFTGIDAHDGSLNNKREEIDSMKNLTIDSEEVSDMNVRMEGDTGIVTGVYRVRGKDNKGKAFDRTSRFTDLYVKRDGRWQVLSSQGTPIQK